MPPDRLSTPVHEHPATDRAATWLEDYVRRVVDTFPPLTREQLDRIAVLLRPDPTEPGETATA